MPTGFQHKRGNASSTKGGRVRTVPAITAVSMAVAAPTKAEYDALATKFNTLIANMKTAGQMEA